VTTIVTKLGYSKDEIYKYVTTDKNSFVGVLYHKLVEDLADRQSLFTKRDQTLS